MVLCHFPCPPRMDTQDIVKTPSLTLGEIGSDLNFKTGVLNQWVVTPLGEKWAVGDYQKTQIFTL